MIDIVVCLGDCPGTAAGLQVRETGADIVPDPVDLHQWAAAQFHSHHAPEKRVQLVGVPVAIHVGFAKPKRAAQNPPIKAIIINTDVPGIIAVMILMPALLNVSVEQSFGTMHP